MSVRVIVQGANPYREGDRVVNAYAGHPAHTENTLGVLGGKRCTVPLGHEGQVYQVIEDRVLVLYRGAAPDGGPLWAWYWPENLSPVATVAERVREEVKELFR